MWFPPPTLLKDRWVEGGALYSNQSTKEAEPQPVLRSQKCPSGCHVREREEEY